MDTTVPAAAPQLVSSRVTLLLRWAFPTFLGVFFGFFVLFVVAYVPLQGGSIPPTLAKAMLVMLYLSALGLMYWAIRRLFRVDMDDAYCYVSNYIITYRYTIDSVRRILERKILGMPIVTLELHQRGKWGQHLHFIAGRRWEHFKAQHPDLPIGADAVTPTATA